MLGAVVDQDHHRRRRDALHQPIQQGLRLTVEPVHILEYEEDRLPQALSQQQPAHAVLHPVPALDGITITGGRLQANSALRACLLPPETPIDLIARGGDGQIALAWTAALGAIRYNVKRSLAAGGPYITIAPGVAVGSEVRKGQLIGWVGDSGNAESTTPHTHFELRKDNRAINPYGILQEAYDRDRDHEEWLVTMVADAAMARMADISVE